MSGHGPPPKVQRQGLNATAKRAGLVVDDKLRGIELPPNVLPDDAQWHPMTVEWWNGWRRSPQAATMLTGPDWTFLLDTALMHHIMWAKGRWEFAAEIRLRVAKFGATPEDRLRLKFEIQPPIDAKAAGGPTPTGVSNLADRRNRLTS